MKNMILSLLSAGKTYAEIAEELGCSKANISYHATNNGMGHGARNRHDWAAVQLYHDEGHSVRECAKEFGFSIGTWGHVVKTGKIVPREWRITVEELTSSGRGTQRTHLKGRLIRGGFIKEECNQCSLTHWNGKKLSLVLDHINGISDDNRIENLRLLCPNCNSQTDTFGGKNIGRRALLV